MPHGYMMKSRRSIARRRTRGGAYTCKQLYGRDRDGFGMTLTQKAKLTLCKYILAPNAYRNHMIDLGTESTKKAAESTAQPRTTRVRFDTSKNTTTEIPNKYNQGGRRYRIKRSRKTRRKRKS